jgi:hypothetical protein
MMYLILAVVFIFGVLIFLAYTVPAEEIKTTEIPAEKFIMHFNDAEIHKRALFREIEKIAFDVAIEKEYELHVYDCTEFSEELGKRLRAIGYNAYCVFGRWEIPEYKKHTWIEINIDGELLEVESTGGYIIPEEDFKEYTIKSKGKCL